MCSSWGSVLGTGWFLDYRTDRILVPERGAAYGYTSRRGGIKRVRRGEMGRAGSEGARGRGEVPRCREEAANRLLAFYPVSIWIWSAWWRRTTRCACGGCGCGECGAVVERPQSTVQRRGRGRGMSLRRWPRPLYPPIYSCAVCLLAGTVPVCTRSRRRARGRPAGDWGIGGLKGASARSQPRRPRVWELGLVEVSVC